LTKRLELGFLLGLGGVDSAIASPRQTLRLPPQFSELLNVWVDANVAQW